MSSKVKKLFVIVLAISMVLGMLSPVQAAVSPAKAAVITRGDVCKAVNALIGATKESSKMKNIANYTKDDPYYSAVSIAYNAGYIIPNKNSELTNASAKANYNFVAIVLSRILKCTRLEVLGKHNPYSTLTASGLKTYLAEVFPTVITKNVSGKTYIGNVILNKPDITLKNITVKGNLVIGDGVADKEAILENVTVTGKLIVRGGGENSIKILGSSNISSIEIIQVNNIVSIKVSNDATVQLVYINDGCDDVILYGPIGTVNIVGDNINVSTSGATISSVTLSGENTSFSVSKDTVVNNVELKESASNAKLEVTGKVAEVVSSAANSSIKVEGTGSIATVIANETAKGVAITVDEKATIKAVSSAASETVISGGGKVEAAKIEGNNSSITTPDTKVTVGDNVTGVKTENNNTSNTTTTPSAGSGSNSGAGTGAGNGSGNGSGSGTGSEDPNGTIVYKTDARFATGYPEVTLGAANTSTNDRNVTVKIKLKEGIASATSPVTVYYVMSSYNTSFETSSEAVVHGHLGRNYTYSGGVYHALVSSGASGYLTFTGSEEQTISESFYYNGEEGLVTYFVIKSASETSSVPTKIAFSKETGSSFGDTNSPFVEGAAWSGPTTDSSGNEYRTIRIFTTEVLDTAKTISSSAFTVTGIISTASSVSGSSIIPSSVTGSSITAVTMHKNNSDNFDPYSDWIDLTLMYPAGSDLSNLQISYDPTISAITDVANIPNVMNPFIVYRTLPSNGYYGDNYLINDSVPIISKISVSNDGKYMALYISPRFVYNSNFSFNITGDGVDMGSWVETHGSYSIGYSCFYLYNATATKASAYNITLTDQQGGKLYDIFGNEYATFTQNNIAPTAYSEVNATAGLNLSSKELTLNLTGTIQKEYYLEYGCQYVLTIDGTSYRLRGIADVDRNYNTQDNTTVTFDAGCLANIDFSKITTPSVVKLSLDSLTTDKDIDSSPGDLSGKPLDILNKVVNVQ